MKVMGEYKLKKLVLYGAGREGEKWLHKIGEDNVYCFADTDEKKSGTIKYGKYIKSVQELYSMKDNISIFITTSPQYKKDIFALLQKSRMEDVVVTNPYSIIMHAELSATYDTNTEFGGHNYLGVNARIHHSKIGYASYLSNDVELGYVCIGKYTCIGPGVTVIRGQHPARKFVSMHPAFYSVNNAVTDLHYVEEQRFEEYRYVESEYAVKIGSDVWIGKNAMLMEGITIGDGVIIAAGATVTKDIPSFSIVGGVPAKKIRDRFTKEQREYLNHLKWWDKEEEWIRSKAEYFNDINCLMENVPLGGS